MTIGQETDSALVLRARTDREAFGRLYDRHYAGVLKYCIHRLFDRDTAEDMTSTVFLEVARLIPTFAGPTEDDFANWLYSIATRQIHAHLSKATRRQELLAKAVRSRRLRICTVADGKEGQRLDWPRLYEAIAELSPPEQAAITLRSFEDLPYERIARIVGTKAATVRVIYHRALAKLRARLDKVFGGA